MKYIVDCIYYIVNLYKFLFFFKLSYSNVMYSAWIVFTIL